MNDAILYMRGPSPFGFGPIINDAVVDDLKAFVGMDSRIADEAISFLEAESGFLSDADIERVLVGRVDSKTAQVLQRITRWVGVAIYRRQKLDELLFSIRSLQTEADEQSTTVFQDSELQNLSAWLSRLFAISSISRQKKAERLARSTGNRLEQIQIICDLRPIFDEHRRIIEGLMPVTILKVVCTGIDGLPITLEATLSSKDVSDLAETADVAKRKLQTLHAFAAASGLVIPASELTTSGNKT